MKTIEQLILEAKADETKRDASSRTIEREFDDVSDMIMQLASAETAFDQMGIIYSIYEKLSSMKDEWQNLNRNYYEGAAENMSFMFYIYEVNKKIKNM